MRVLKTNKVQTHWSHIHLEQFHALETGIKSQPDGPPSLESDLGQFHIFIFLALKKLIGSMEEFEILEMLNHSIRLLFV